MGTRIEGVHCTHNLSRMLPLSRLGEVGSPSVEDLVEGAVEGEGEGALRREHPPGLVTRIVSNSFNMDWKWPPRSPIWLRARGIKRRVAED